MRLTHDDYHEHYSERFIIIAILGGTVIIVLYDLVIIIIIIIIVIYAQLLKSALKGEGEGNQRQVRVMKRLFIEFVNKLLVVEIQGGQCLQPSDKLLVQSKHFSSLVVGCGWILLLNLALLLLRVQEQSMDQTDDVKRDFGIHLLDFCFFEQQIYICQGPYM